MSVISPQQIVNGELLQKAISTLKSSQEKKRYLINCLESHGKIIKEISIKPIKLNCKDLRSERQKINNLYAHKYLVAGNVNKLKIYINELELGRVMVETELTLRELFNKCKTDDIFAKVLAGRISKCASRQGSKDEKAQLDSCNITTSLCGVNIENLSATAYRPTTSGEIIDNKKYKCYEKNDCLKSFDAKITGKVEGWIFAKVTYGGGGHQDNVDKESDDFCQWVLNFGDPDKLYVVLWDTDLKYFKTLRNKYHKKNLLVVNHVQFQQYIIDTYCSHCS